MANMRILANHCSARLLKKWQNENFSKPLWMLLPFHPSNQQNSFSLLILRWHHSECQSPPPIPPNFKPIRKIGFLPKKWNGFAMNSCKERCSFGDLGLHKDGILMSRRRIKSLVLVRANQQRFGFNGGWDEESRKKVLGNLALAIGLTYLTMTDQLGWILDAIVSIWLLAVLIPIVGLGVFFWYAGRDIIQSSCPNCGNEFQVLKSSLDDGVQLCPFCTQPFSVEGNKFVREPTKFSSGRSPMSGQVFNGFSQRSNKGTASSTAIVDIEAEVKDIE